MSQRELAEQCRTGRYAQYDPALRCTMDSRTDDEAAKCLEAFANAVVHPTPGEGSGVNPPITPAQ